MESREELLKRLQFTSKYRKISPFEVYRGLKTIKRSYKISAATREELNAKYEELLKKLADEFGEYMFEETHVAYGLKRDNNGNIIERTKDIIFACFVPIRKENNLPKSR